MYAHCQLRADNCSENSESKLFISRKSIRLSSRWLQTLLHAICVRIFPIGSFKSVRLQLLLLSWVLTRFRVLAPGQFFQLFLPLFANLQEVDRSSWSARIVEQCHTCTEDLALRVF
jgi:hypothetical protein